MTTDERAFIAEAISKRRASLERMTQRRDELQAMLSALNSFIYGVKCELNHLLDVKDTVFEPDDVEFEMLPSEFRNMLL